MLSTFIIALNYWIMLTIDSIMSIFNNRDMSVKPNWELKRAKKALKCSSGRNKHELEDKTMRKKQGKRMSIFLIVANTESLNCRQIIYVTILFSPDFRQLPENCLFPS